MDEIAFLRQTVRVYRHIFSEIHDAVRTSESHAARRVIEELVEGQRRLNKLKAQAPAELLPMEARKRDGLVALEEFR